MAIALWAQINYGSAMQLKALSFRCQLLVSTLVNIAIAFHS